ncbi:gap junction delta-4 protein [Amia ocellicauda]|uniref:gap junction delta-4 protein n=1 Tax=Amia ocellicauda TaxID=2972642 RepID=UPI003464384E
MGRWDALDLIFLTLNRNITIVGKIWLTLILLLRLLFLLLAGYPLYQDEQERFVCNTIQPGCSNVCYDVFSPLSHFRFWVVQLIALCLLYVIFVVYVIHKVAAAATDESCASNRATASSLCKIHQEPIRNAPKTAFEAKLQKIPNFSGAYIFHLLLRIIFEAGFGAGQYYLFGFLIPKRFLCYETPCTSMVDCYISRPTEKTLMLNFMFGVSAWSFLLNIADLICVIKRSLRQKRRDKVLMEKMYEEEEYYLSPASINVDSCASAAFHKRRNSKASADEATSMRLDEADRLSTRSDVLSPHSAESNTNGNNVYTQAQEEQVDREGSEVALCLSESAATPRLTGKYYKHRCLRAQTSLLREKVPAGETEASAGLCSRRIGQYTLVEMTDPDLKSNCSETRERRSEWV